MLKITFSLFIYLFVAKSVSSGECPQTDASKCPDKEDEVKFFKCLNDSATTQPCEPPKICIEGRYTGIFTKNKVILKGCRIGGCEKHKEEFFTPILGQKAMENSVAQCCALGPGHSCEFHRVNVGASKGIKGSNNSTAAPKKSRGSRSRRITIIHHTPILVHILFSLFPFFGKF